MRNAANDPQTQLRQCEMAVMTPKISIVTCSFNQAPFISATLRSVIGQNIDGVEYLVIDGGSTDGSVDIIRRHQAGLADWISESDAGQSAALNKGLARATGEIVGWLCSDDMLLPGALGDVVKFFKAHPDVDAIYGDSVFINEKGIPLRMKREIGFFPWLLINDHNYVPQPSMFWRRRVHERVGYLRDDLHLTMDLEMWLRFEQCGLKVKHVNRCWSAMRCHGGQKVNVRVEEIKRENEFLRREYSSSFAACLPASVVRGVARLVRVAAKGLNGGYWASYPAGLESWLARLHGEESA